MGGGHHRQDVPEPPLGVLRVARPGDPLARAAPGLLSVQLGVAAVVELVVPELVAVTWCRPWTPWRLTDAALTEVAR